MKYIKLFEDDKYKLVKGEIYNRSPRNKFDDYEIHKIKSFAENYNFHSINGNEYIINIIKFKNKRSKSTNLSNIRFHFIIKKGNDDYFFVKFKMLNSYYTYYMCDQIHGLLILMTNKMKTHFNK